MIVLLAFVGVTIFLLGLWQWAQGGASLWRIFRLQKNKKGLTREEKAQAEREVRELERTADRTITASFRIIAVLAVFVWLFLGASVLLRMFGIDMIGKLTTHAKAYWSQPAVQNSQTMTQQRNDMLRNMGNSLRR
jgi:hypothetical protein